jgi:hypothetical protein
MRLKPDELVRISRFIGLTRYACKQNGALMTSATQRPQRPFVSKLKPRGLSSRNSILRGLFLAVGITLCRAGQDLLGDQAGILADRHLDLGGHVGVGLEERL